jgi:pimeloyl-ACP methyl ester carboxylesterase
VSRRSRGDVTGAPILFVHGDFGDGFEAWGAACDQIGRRCRSIVVDRPGAGETLEPDARFSFAGDADEVLEIMSELGVRSCHLVGHSYGALVAIAVATRRPETIRSLHLIEPPLLAIATDAPEVRAMDRRVREIQAGYAVEGEEAATEAFFTAIGAEHVVGRLRGSPDWHRLCLHAARLAASEPAGDFRPQSLQALPRSLPVTVYTGGRSHPALREVARRVAAAIDGARLIDVPEAGHAVQMVGTAFVDPLLASVAEADAAWGSG